MKIYDKFVRILEANTAEGKDTCTGYKSEREKKYQRSQENVEISD